MLKKKRPDIKVSELQLKLRRTCPENTEPTGDRITLLRLLVFSVVTNYSNNFRNFGELDVLSTDLWRWILLLMSHT